jgi:hypothetical protein
MVILGDVLVGTTDAQIIFDENAGKLRFWLPTQSIYGNFTSDGL